MATVDHTVIEFKNVCLSYGGLEVLKNISFKVDKGEKFVLIGPSGQGKSCILKLIAGLLKPTSGEVLIHQKDIWKVSEDERMALNSELGMLFQKNALFDSMTAGENIAFSLREIKKISEEEIAKKVQYFLTEVAIPNTKDLFPDEMSGGMQKRLGIARALVLEPKIVLYDDPTAGLDPITSRRIVSLINMLQMETKSTFVAVTNDMQRAYQMAHTIALLADGELIITGDEEETLQCTDERVRQFIRGKLFGPLTVIQ